MGDYINTVNLPKFEEFIKSVNQWIWINKWVMNQSVLIFFVIKLSNTFNYLYD